MRALLIIIACFLFIGIANLPIGYFTFLRIITSMGAILVIVKEYNKEINFWIITFAIIVVIFNPILPIYLNSKAAWSPIDLICGVLFLLKSFNLKQR
jgi:hypothetical protein